jgi:hypothetical protein
MQFQNISLRALRARRGEKSSPLRKGPSERNQASQPLSRRQRQPQFEPASFLVTKPATENQHLIDSYKD